MSARAERLGGNATRECVVEGATAFVNDYVRDAAVDGTSHRVWRGSSPGGRPATAPVSSGAMASSNRGFWKVFLALGAGGIALVVLIIAFRPVARTGAVAFAQRNLRAAAAAAQRVAEAEGSLESATALRMGSEPDVDDLLFIDPDTSSNDSEIVSVRATETAWTGAARSDTGACFWVRVEATGRTVVGTGTDCSAEEASEAPPGAWPEP